MSQEQRRARLAADLEALEQLQQASSVFQFEPTGDPPDRYNITFHGKGIYRDLSPQSQIETIDLHRCELRLPYSYPQRPPDIRWLTPIFHPNVSFGGFLNFRDLGLEWSPETGLEVVCERLWDVARLAHMDLDQATNFAAKTWFQRAEMQLPIDARPLRDRPPAATNVVHYQRKGQPPPLRLPRREVTDVLFIGPDTPAPPVPRTEPSPDDDIFYIGDE